MQMSIVPTLIDDTLTKGGYIYSVVGTQATLLIGTAALILVAVVYLVSLIGLLKRKTWAPANYSHLHRKPHHRRLPIRVQCCFCVLGSLDRDSGGS
jgi:hypothetical protein